MKKTAKNYSETILINGKHFTYFPNKAIKPISRYTAYGYNDIFEAYDRPSREKINIWESWKKWFWDCRFKSDCSIDYFNLYIGSRNTFQFTIGGSIVDPETGECLVLDITASHNYCYPVKVD